MAYIFLFNLGTDKAETEKEKNFSIADCAKFVNDYIKKANSQGHRKKYQQRKAWL